MKNRLLYIGFIILLVTSFANVCGCINTNSNSLQSTEYIALSVEHNEEGMLISGNAPPRHLIQEPGIFYYNKDLIRSHYGNSISFPHGYPAMNDSLKILLGVYYNELRPWNQSGYLVVSGIYSYPYIFENELTILDIDKNGTVLLRYDNDSIYLKKGDIWKSPIVSARSETYNEPYTNTDINGNSMVENYSYTVKWVTTWTITNLGVYHK